MPGPEAIDWIARIDRELEPLRRSWQRLQPGIEQFSKTLVAAREAWRPHLETWRRLSAAFVAARDRGDFRVLWMRLRLGAWIAQQFNNAKDNPSHPNARVWLTVGHLTPKQIAGLMPYLMMDVGDLRVPRRRGRQKGRTAPSTLKMVEELAERIKRTGEPPTTAARHLVVERGFRGADIKNQADHLVKVWRSRVFKCR
jgi:hypothetical protein